jgi:peroxiredoxin
MEDKVLDISIISRTCLLALSLVGLSIAADTPAERDYKLHLPSGEVLTLSQQRRKPVVVAFFSPTCSHCRQIATQLERIYKAESPRGLQVFGVVITDKPATVVPSFVQELGLSYPVGSDWREGTCGFISCAGRLTMPVIVFVDRKGQILPEHRGRDPILGEEHLLAEAVKALVSGAEHPR